MKYRVVKPCVVKSDGEVVHYLKTGATVEVNDHDAKPLVVGGRLKPVKSESDTDKQAEKSRAAVKLAKAVEKSES